MGARARPLSNVAVRVLALFVGLGTVMSSRLALASAELHVDGSYFRDATGGAVILRGVNVAGNAKIPPFRALRTPADLDPLPAWGINAIRLLFTWEAYEPERASYDETYLDEVLASADEAWKRGIYTVIDFHQDAFSRYSVGGCGDGFPEWALAADVQPLMPDNGPACADWGLRMLGDMPMQESWSAFHQGDNGVRASFLAMVERVAARMSGVPGVIGYDILNEPWGDEATDLAALHRDAGQAIRSADPSAILFLSPHAIVSSGLVGTRLPPPTLANVVYSPHYYDGNVSLSKSWGGVAPEAPFASMRATATEWGVPLFLGEFGAPATTENVAGYLDAIFDLLNETFASGAQWVYTPAWTPDAKDGWNAEDFSTVDDSGTLRANFRVRPYPERIAGTPQMLRVTHEALASGNVFELAWDHVAGAGATRVYLPREAFFGTTSIDVVTDGEGVDCAFDGLYLSCGSEVSGTKKVVVRSTIAADAGTPDSEPSGEDDAMRDAGLGDSNVARPELTASGGCSCTVVPSGSGHDARAFLGLAVAGLAAVAKRNREVRRWRRAQERSSEVDERPR